VSVKKVHGRFLAAERSLAEARRSWDRVPRWVRRCLEWALPVPLLALDERGRRLHEALLGLERSCREVALSEEVLRAYPARLLPEHGGRYRSSDFAMDPANPLRPPPAGEVPRRMRLLEARLQGWQEAWDRAPDPEEVFRRAVELHWTLGRIHPFADGNGRVARLAMNHLLRRYGRGYVIYPSLGESDRFWELLQRAGSPEGLSALVDFARTCEERP
jgi:prophage maintenance system killer protein